LKQLTSSPLTWLLMLFAVIALLAAGGPPEKSLGSSVRVVYLHGAWVWTALAAFFAAGLSGLAALLTHQDVLHSWSRALGRTGLVFWISYLPISVWAMQTNWNGLYLAEPRWRLALIFAVSGLLLQIGLALVDKAALTSAANLGFIVVLLVALSGTREVMHPRSPILESGSTLIQAYFAVLVAFMLLAAWQVARGWLQLEAASRGNLPQGQNG
jgi:hypothetical protein